MALRTTGWAQLFASTVQEVMDLAAVAHASAREARIPFLHVFDSFPTAQETQRIELLADDDLRALLSHDPSAAYHDSAASVEVTTARTVQRAMDRLARLTGRQYRLFDFAGVPDAKRVIVLMGSGAAVARGTARLLAARGERVGVVTVRLYRPFNGAAFLRALPASVRSIAVLDRTELPSPGGAALYQDVATTISEALCAGAIPLERFPRIIGGRYGTGPGGCTPAMMRAVFDELARVQPRHQLAVGADAREGETALPASAGFTAEDPAAVRAIFWGFGADGMVSASKRLVSLLNGQTACYAQGCFPGEPPRSRARTLAHLRISPRPIDAPYLIEQTTTIVVQRFELLRRPDVLAAAEPGATLLLNAPYGPRKVWAQLPPAAQEAIRVKRLRLFTIDASRVARAAGRPRAVSLVMQTCFLVVSGVLPPDRAVALVKQSLQQVYGKRGPASVREHAAPVEAALAHLQVAWTPVPTPQQASAQATAMSNPVPKDVAMGAGGLVSAC